MDFALPRAVQVQVETVLSSPIVGCQRLPGGDISPVARVWTRSGERPIEHVVKWRQVRTGDDLMFPTEAQGLVLLRQAWQGSGGLAVPEVLAYGEAGSGYSFLLMTYLPPARATPEFHEALGRGLAELHRHSHATLGDAPDNFFGRLPQSNPFSPSAADFFWHARLRPQLVLARDHLTSHDQRQFELLRDRLPQVIPVEAPSLVHGDMWQGNVLYTRHGPALIDPAVSYSHREVDLSLMRLFGGFPERVFAAYAESFPPADGHAERAALWNLYPLLAHVNMFGAAYLPRTREALARALAL